jgi:hypothetical protein
MIEGVLSFQSMAEVVSLAEIKRLRWSDAEQRGAYKKAQVLLWEFRAVKDKPETFIHSLCGGAIMLFDLRVPEWHS